MNNRQSKSVAVAFLVVLALGGCQTWSTANVKLKTNQSDVQTGSSNINAAVSKRIAADILVTEQDIVGRHYRVIGDLDVTVNKTTIFHDDPTRAMVDKKLQEEAEKLGADAVILVRYGTVGISMMSWGALDAKGQAVAYTN